MKFIRTTAINKLLRLRKRIRVIPGGTSAGKTMGILPILIDRATKEANLEISVVSESIPHLRRGALKDFLKIMRSTGRYIDKNYNRTLLTYTFTNGSYIEFFSADQEDKVKGARRNILYLNEANNLDFETYHQLAIRTDMQVWIDFNPSNEFWAHKELNDDPDTEWLTLTYQDNEALSSSIIKELEKAREKAFFNSTLSAPKLLNKLNIKNHYWANWWKVYGLGMTGTLDGVIFTDWKQIAQVPPEARVLNRGLDFGFTNDPTAGVELYKWNQAIIYHEVMYEKGLLNSEIASKLKTANRLSPCITYADSAEPKSIAEISNYGVRMKPVVKGADSVKFGLDLMQEHEMYVTSSSTNLISELRKYSWDKDKKGNLLNVPVDAFNHAIDAARYGALMGLTKRRRGVTIRVNRS
jgi:phage terminase large subunit